MVVLLEKKCTNLPFLGKINWFFKNFLDFAFYLYRLTYCKSKHVIQRGKMRFKIKLCIAMAMVCCIPYFSMAGVEESYMKCVKHIKKKEDVRDCMREIFHSGELGWSAMQVMCSANPQLPVCESVNRLITEGENYFAVLKAELILSAQLRNVERPYLEQLCRIQETDESSGLVEMGVKGKEIPPYMTHMCESLNTLKEVKETIEQINREVEAKERAGDAITDQILILENRLNRLAANTEAYYRMEDLIKGMENELDDLDNDWDDAIYKLYDTKDELDEEKRNRDVIEIVTMEIVCDLNEGLATSCEVSDTLRANREIIHQFKTELESTILEISQQMDLMCASEHYRSALCDL